MLETHRDSGADATVAVIPVAEDQTSAFGILKMDNSGRIVHFDEKPPRRAAARAGVRAAGRRPAATWRRWASTSSSARSSSRRSPTRSSSTSAATSSPTRCRASACRRYVYRGYWEDVGTIQSYFQANLALCEPIPPFDFYDAKRPVYTHPRFLPASKLEGCNIQQRAGLRGLHPARRRDRPRRSSASAAASARAPRSRNSLLHRRRLLRDAGRDAGDRGARRAARSASAPDSVIENAIVDKNARIGRGVRIVNEAGRQERRRRRLLHPRGDRDRPQERRHPERHRHLTE